MPEELLELDELLDDDELLEEELLVDAELDELVLDVLEEELPEVLPPQATNTIRTKDAGNKDRIMLGSLSGCVGINRILKTVRRPARLKEILQTADDMDLTSQQIKKGLLRPF